MEGAAPALLVEADPMTSQNVAPWSRALSQDAAPARLLCSLPPTPLLQPRALWRVSWAGLPTFAGRVTGGSEERDAGAGSRGATSLSLGALYLEPEDQAVPPGGHRAPGSTPRVADGVPMALWPGNPRRVARVHRRGAAAAWPVPHMRLVFPGLEGAPQGGLDGRLAGGGARGDGRRAPRHFVIDLPRSCTTSGRRVGPGPRRGSEA